MLKPYEIELVFKKDGESGLEAALAEECDLILLDIMLPKKDGWEICRELKEKSVEIPIIMLTAKVEETDKVLGLEMGADDYVTKPFSPRELMARIKAVLRRFEKTREITAKEGLLKFPKIGLKVNLKSRNIYVRDTKVTVAPKEFELFSFLAKHPKEAFSREDLLGRIWGADTDKKSRTIDEHIKRLRKKLKKVGIREVPLKTVWGVGYKFEIEAEEK